jgi:flagellar motor switch protein FliM
MKHRPVGQVLSQDEVDALLSAVDRGELPEATPVAAGAVRGQAILRYNFRKPNRVSKDQVKMLHSIHESFARLYSASLTTLLRGLADIELRSVEQATYGEFIMSLSPPTCLVIFNMDPLKGAAAMEINAGVLFRVIDRLLGGSGLLPVRLREFTEVEQVLIERTAIRAMMDLQQAWQHGGTFAFRVAQLETNPQFVQLTAPNEVVIVVTFDVKLGEASGQMILAYPHLLLEPVMPKLNTHRYFAMSQRAVSPQEDRGLKENLLRLHLGVRGVLADVGISVRRLLELRPGDVLPLDRPATAPATVELEGVPRFTARPGTSNRHRAMRILAEIPRGEVIRDGTDRSSIARVHAS